MLVFKCGLIGTPASFSKNMEAYFFWCLSIFWNAVDCWLHLAQGITPKHPGHPCICHSGLLF